MTRGLCFRPAVPVPIIAGYLLGKYPPLSPAVRQVLLFSHMLHKLNNKWTEEKQLLLYLLQYMYTDRSHFVFLQLLGAEKYLAITSELANQCVRKVQYYSLVWCMYILMGFVLLERGTVIHVQFMSCTEEHNTLKRGAVQVLLNF